VDDDEIADALSVVGLAAGMELEIGVEMTTVDDGITLVLSLFGLAIEDSIIGFDIGVEVAVADDGIAAVLSQFALVGKDAVTVLEIGVEATAVDDGEAVFLSQFEFAREVTTMEPEIERDEDTVDDGVAVAVSLSEFAGRLVNNGVAVVLSLSEFTTRIVAGGGSTVVGADHKDMGVDSTGSNKTVVSDTEAVDDGVSDVLSQFKFLVVVGVVGRAVMLIIDTFEHTETQASSYAACRQCRKILITHCSYLTLTFRPREGAGS